MHHPNWAIVATSISLLSAAMVWVDGYAKKKHWSLLKQRKYIHICWGFVALIIPLLSSQFYTLAWSLGFSLMLHLGLRTNYSVSNKHCVWGIEKPVWGDVLLYLSIIALFPFYNQNRVLYWIPILLICFSDAVVFFLGENQNELLSKKDWKKTFSLALSSGLLIAAVLFVETSMDIKPVLLISLILSLLTLLVRSQSWECFDLLLIPVGSALLLEIFVLQDPSVLLSQIFILLSLMIVSYIAKRLKILDVPASLCLTLTLYIVFLHGGFAWISPSIVLLFSHLMYVYIFKDIQKYSLEAVLSITSCGFFWVLFDHYSILSMSQCLFLYIFSMSIHQWFLVIIRLKYISKHPHKKLPIYKRIITFWSCSVVFSDVFIFVDPFSERIMWFTSGLCLLAVGCLLFHPKKNLYSVERWAVEGISAILLPFLLLPIGPL